MDPAEIIALRSDLRQKVLSKFKKRSLGSEEGHPDLMDKLEKKIEENLNELAKKNKAMWNDKFRAVAEEVT